MTNYSHLWNDLPEEERKRLMPYQIECQIRHTKAARLKAVRAHERHLREIDELVKYLESRLKEIEAQNGCR